MPRILIIDDERAIRSAIREILEYEKYEVDEAADGMIGGGSDNPNVFKESELFSSVRITLAPMLIVVGYIVIFYAIMKRNKNDQTEA